MFVTFHFISQLTCAVQKWRENHMMKSYHEIWNQAHIAERSFSVHLIDERTKIILIFDYDFSLRAPSSYFRTLKKPTNAKLRQTFIDKKKICLCKLVHVNAALWQNQWGKGFFRKTKVYETLNVSLIGAVIFVRSSISCGIRGTKFVSCNICCVFFTLKCDCFLQIKIHSMWMRFSKISNPIHSDMRLCWATEKSTRHLRTSYTLNPQNTHSLIKSV